MPIYGWKRRRAAFLRTGTCPLVPFPIGLRRTSWYAQAELTDLTRVVAERAEGDLKRRGGNDIRKGCGIVVSGEVGKMHGGVVIEGGTLAKWLP